MLHTRRSLFNAAMPFTVPSSKMWSPVCQNPTATTRRVPEESHLHKANCDWQACGAPNEGNHGTKVDLRAEGLTSEPIWNLISNYFLFFRSSWSRASFIRRESCLSLASSTAKNVYQIQRWWRVSLIMKPQLTLSFSSQVVCQPRCIVEPKEICQTIVCQPKPQTIQIPAPREFICAPTGTTFVNRPGCPPVPVLPLGKPCYPYPPKDFNCWTQ